MNKLEKVILGMECCISNDDRCDECPYMTGKEQIGEMNGEPEYVYGCNRPTLIADALTLLKSQVPVEPKLESASDETHWYSCECGTAIDYKDAYCRGCGRAVKWE